MNRLSVLGKGEKIAFTLPSSTLDGRPVHRLCILFEIVLQFSLPTLFKVETWKKFWIYVSNFVCGLRGGFGSCVNWKTPQKCKSVPRLLSIILVSNPRLSNHSDLVGILPILLEIPNPDQYSIGTGKILIVTSVVINKPEQLPQTVLNWNWYPET